MNNLIKRPDLRVPEPAKLGILKSFVEFLFGVISKLIGASWFYVIGPNLMDHFLLPLIGCQPSICSYRRLQASTDILPSVIFRKF